MKTLHATNPPMRGPDVRKVQALLIDHGYKIKRDGVFGPATIAAVLDAKKRLGYSRDQRKPIAGEQFVGKLEHARKPLVPATKPHRPTVRQRIVEYLKWGIANEPAIHYKQVRPMPGTTRHLPASIDCSAFVTLAYKDAGAKDPNGAGYDGTGYTGTLLAHGKPITLAQALPGDLVIFGAFPGVHVCAVLEAGADPLLASHGQERGPVAVRYSVERAYHASHGHGSVSFRRYLA